MRETELLTADTVLGYLRVRDIDLGDDQTATELGGGVSNVVIRATGTDRSVIVKQSLPQLRVEALWSAPIERVITEGRALQICGSLVPGLVPAVLDIDESAFAISIDSAPSGWIDWKQALMARVAVPGVGALVGDGLGAVHRLTTKPDGLPIELLDPEPFELLRLEPYYRTAAEAVPSLSVQIHEQADLLRTDRRCLVHGDFSPKNILIAPQGGQVWVIDFEVAHFGNPTFDVAFLLSHLTMKAVHLPIASDLIWTEAREFLAAYLTAAAVVDSSGFEEFALRQAGALLLARVHGKSPAEYLLPAQRDTVHDLGRMLILGEVSGLSALIDAVTVSSPVHAEGIIDDFATEEP